MKLYAPDPHLEIRPDITAALVFRLRCKVDRLRPNRSEERYRHHAADLPLP